MQIAPVICTLIRSYVDAEQRLTKWSVTTKQTRTEKYVEQDAKLAPVGLQVHLLLHVKILFLLAPIQNQPPVMHLHLHLHLLIQNAFSALLVHLKYHVIAPYPENLALPRELEGFSLLRKHLLAKRIADRAGRTTTEFRNGAK